MMRPIILCALALGACSPTPVRQAAPAAPRVAPAPPAPAPPAKKATMICRNSETGASAKCGTPNAVMVGIKTE